MTKAKIVKSLLISIVIIFSSCNIKIEPNSVDVKEYLNKGENPTDIYDNNVGKDFINPFNFGHTDFGRLILISIDDHPTIETVELVVQKDQKGAFVVVYFNNGKVENYLNPFVTLNKKYLKPNSDWEISGTQDFDFTFEDTKQGLFLTLDFKIKSGEHIQINLKENQTNLKRYSFLAAIGADLTDVKRFPFIYLRESGFVPVENTKIEFKVDNEPMKITKVPIKVENKSCYKIVYSLSPLPFFWNEEQNENFKLENEIDNVAYEFFDNSGFQEIKSITYNLKNHKSTYKFSPCFPLVSAMKNDTEVNGKFSLGVDEIDGIIGGEYSLKKENGDIIISFSPKKCWQPMPGDDWVSNYEYNSIIKVLAKDSINIKSEWIIKK